MHPRSERSAVILLRCTRGRAPHAVDGPAHLHEAKLVHLDMKPDGLLLAGPLMLHPDCAALAAGGVGPGLSRRQWMDTTYA